MGRLTRAQVTGPRFERLARGVHRTVGGPPPDHGLLVRAAVEALHRPVVLAELSAAWALGVPEAGTDDAVVVVSPRPAPRSRPGLVVRQSTLRRDDLVRTPLGWSTSPARTAVDLLRTLADGRGLRTAEAVAHRWSVTVPRLEAEMARQAGARGLLGARRLLPRLDPAAESPRETDLRLLLVDAGLPAPAVQHVVHDADGAFVARLDLAWPAWRVAVEYDGDHHRDRRQHSADLARHHRLRALGWVVLQVDAATLARPGALLHQLRQLLSGPRD